MKIRIATVLGALIHITLRSEMVAHAIQLAGGNAMGTTAVNTKNVRDHPTVDLSKEDVKKLAAVVNHLARAKIIAIRAYVIRAMLRAAPDGKSRRLA